MITYFIEFVLYLAVTIILVHADGVESLNKRVSKIERITAAFWESGGRRLGTDDGSETKQSELDHLTEIYSLMWRGDQLGVRVIFSGDEPDADTQLKNALDQIDGFDVHDCRSYMCSGWCDLHIIDDVESLQEVGQISASQMPETHGDFTGSGSVRTQAIAATQIKKVVQKYPELTGAGVKIGVISDSFNRNELARTTEEDDINSGDLPGGSNRVKIIDDVTVFPGAFYSDEGRAMAQLIHDLVPDAQLVFHTGFTPGGNFAGAIDALVDEGCDIIVDDVRTDQEPIFQLGLSALAANRAAEENGIAYFTSVRNLGSSSWEDRGYNEIPCLPIPELVEGNYTSCHDFGDGNSVQFIPILRPFTKFTFYWDDPWQSISGPPGPQTDLDIFFFNATTGELLYSGIESNTNGDATEAFTIVQPGEYLLVISKRSGPSPSIIKWINLGIANDPLGLGISATNTETGNAPGTAAVGAASEKQTFSELLLQPFSSRGGIPLIFDDNGNRLTEELVLNQPRFVGPDGSYTTFYGLEGKHIEVTEANPPPRFFGTSCSATNIAAVAALLVQATSFFKIEGRRGLKTVKSGKKVKSTKGDKKTKKAKKGEIGSADFVFPYDLYNIMEETAIDMNESGFDFLTGHGFVNAMAAVEAIKNVIKAEDSEEWCPVENFLDPIQSYY
mmetsp:Transcript_14275/g.33238  ORF Transcript_14275/g.33238 Transcript_14275/m.33238 type:complete len:673 (+) Transcript_14275:107-2125(+)|eukprot:CAMPEP_0197187878 /NCGR_PEP_ID=MMETSP1423-20130617/16772_1 /TAXON_ID=476441 /ORGANISM="Pseudo-nitzschia heimii, Strain UNC1101" /LENGTH=672 /DNA_ID=CAMNT_0042639575 /DNA_START=13 /DNA_END=2031 /DNA_ORIENTATION=-